MKKNILYIFLIQILFGSSSLFAGVQFVCNELLGRPTNHSITIHAETDKAVEYYYEYGEDSLSFSIQTEVKTSADSVPFVVVLDDLKENTKYYYRLKYREVGTEEFISRSAHWFTTQRSEDASFRFAIEADPHLDTNSVPSALALTFKNILSYEPDFMLDLGDTFMCEKLPNKSQSEVTKRHLYLRSFFDTVCHSVPLYLVIGNHEAEWGNITAYTDKSLCVMASNTRKLYYPNPEPDNFYSGNTISEEYVGLRQNYYSWQWGNALFVVLDPYWYSTQKLAWGVTLGEEQYNWFKNVLASSNAKFKFVFCHNLVGGAGKDMRGGAEAADFYEWGGRDTNNVWSFEANRPGWGKPIHQLMVEYGVSAFFHGHDHLYAKQEKDGIIYQEVPQPSNRNLTNTQANQYGYKSGTILPGRGFLLVSVSDSTAKVEFIKTLLTNEEKENSHNGDVADSYIITKAKASIIEKTEKSGIRIFPNPVSSFVNIEIDYNNISSVEIYNLKGDLVKSFNISNNNSKLSLVWDCLDNEGNKLVSGDYFWRITINGVIKTEKFSIVE